MKIIKKIDFTKNFGFNIYKPENENQFFYILLIESYKKTNLIVQKYNSELKLCEKFEEKSFLYPKYNPFGEMVEGEEEDEIDSLILEDECIYKIIVDDINNFIILYHRYYGPPFEYICYFLYNCINKELKKEIKLDLAYIPGDDSPIFYDLIKIDKDKLVLAKGDEDKGIKEIEIKNLKEYSDKECKKTKKINISISDELAQSEEDIKDDNEVKKNKKEKKKKKSESKLLGKKKRRNRFRLNEYLLY